MHLISTTQLCSMTNYKNPKPLYFARVLTQHDNIDLVYGIGVLSVDERLASNLWYNVYKLFTYLMIIYVAAISGDVSGALIARLYDWYQCNAMGRRRWCRAVFSVEQHLESFLSIKQPGLELTSDRLIDHAGRPIRVTPRPPHTLRILPVWHDCTFTFFFLVWYKQWLLHI